MRHWLVLGLLWGCGGEAPSPQVSTSVRHNVVVVLSDALRASNLELYGYPRQTAPFIAELAKDAAVFEHAFAHYPGTPVSVSQLMTGRYQPPQLMRTRLFGVAVRDLPADYPLLPRVFGEAGYKTGLITGHPWFEDSSRLEAHFDHFEVVRDPEERYPPFQGLLPPVDAFLDGVGEQPFFLYVHAIDTHAPNEVAPGDEDLRVDGVSEDVAAYDSDIRRMDRGVRALVASLEARGLLDDTVFVFLSDHGTEFGEVSDAHYDKNHGLQVRRPLVEIPLVIRLPDKSGAGRYTAPVGLVDVLPTVVRLAAPDLAPPAGDGLDLSPRLLAGKDDPAPRTLLARSMRWWAMYDEDEELLLDRWSGEAAMYGVTRDPNNYARQEPREIRADWEVSLRAQSAKLEREFEALPQNAALAGVVSLIMPSDLDEGSSAPVFTYGESDDRWTLAGRELLAFPGESPGTVRYRMPFVDGRWKVELRPLRDAPFNEGATVRIEGGEPMSLETPGPDGFDLGVHSVTDPLEMEIVSGVGGVSLCELRMTREDVPGAPLDPELRKALEALGYGVDDDPEE
ncbi:MAG: DUF229 domain-containing protein [Deltaproteobacteria bacterium]|nr:MAG: DUF229 domain-containing protein [Deltaproteobacteria bacterium]